MREKAFFVILWVGCATVLAVDNPNVRSPVGPPTVPPSAMGSGLVRSPAYDAYSGNDIVTGNVGGMHHFRGVVPYGSQFYHSRSAYSPVDEFLRRSADPIVNDRSPGQYRSYYEPRRVASSAVSAYSGRLNVPEPTAAGQIDPYKPPMLPQLKDTPFYNRPRPLSASRNELDRILARQYDLRAERPGERGKDKTAQAVDNTEGRSEEKMQRLPTFFDTYLKARQPQTPSEPLKPRPAPQDQPASREKDLSNVATDTAEQSADTEQRAKGVLRDPLLEQYLQNTTVSTELPPLEPQQQQAARALLRQYKTFENLAAARTEEYLLQAEALLAEGQFYKAADTFALAGMWDPQDARPLAGQAFALFAAGEYMSSAYYLAQAIERNAGVAVEPVPLDRLMASRDAYENRLLEMLEWQQKSNSPELAFLLAFVYYQDGKLERAASFIDTASQRMAANEAVERLKQAIDNKRLSPAGGASKD